jgi:hypothetical protein
MSGAYAVVSLDCALWHHRVYSFHCGGPGFLRRGDAVRHEEFVLQQLLTRQRPKFRQRPHVSILRCAIVFRRDILLFLAFLQTLPP